MVRNMTSYRELARNRDFTILWTGETISELGSTMSLFVFPLIGYHLTGSTLVSALLEAAGLFGLCAMLLPAGILADRYDRRALMLMASASGVVLYGSLAVAGWLGALTVPHLAVVALLTGVAQGVFQPAQIAAIRARRPRRGPGRRRTARTRRASTSPRCSAARSAACCTPSARGRRSWSTRCRTPSPASP